MKILEENVLKVLKGEVEEEDLKEELEEEVEEEVVDNEKSNNEAKPTQESGEIILKKWYNFLDEEIVKNSLRVFLKSSNKEELDLLLRDEVSEEDLAKLIYNSLQIESYFKFFKSCTSLDEYVRHLFIFMAQAIIGSNYRYIGKTLFPDVDLTEVHFRGYKKLAGKVMECIDDAKHISYEFSYLNKTIDDFNCDIEKADKSLSERKFIETDLDRFIVGNTYDYLDIEEDDYSGRDWVLHGKGNKYGRMYISYETKETRGLTIGEFYGGAVVD